MLRNDVYEVEQIIGKKYMHSRVLYLVRWKGFSSDHDSWEPGANLGTCKLLIKRYNEEHSPDSENHSKKRVQPEGSSPSLPDKASAAKKLKLSKSDMNVKPVIDNKKNKAASDSVRIDGPASHTSVIDPAQNKKLKQKKEELSKKIENAKGKVQKTKSLDAKHISDHLVVNEHGEVGKKFEVTGKNKDLKLTNRSKSLPHSSQSSLGKKKQSLGAPVQGINVLFKQTSEVGSEQPSNQRIEELKRLVEIQKKKIKDSLASAGGNKTAKCKGDGVQRLNKMCVKVSNTATTRTSKAKGEGSDDIHIAAVATTPEKTVELETVDLTKSPSDGAAFFTPTESIEISDEEDDDEDDGEDVLYSLNPDCDLTDESGSGSHSDSKRDSSGSKSSSVIEISDAAATKSQVTAKDDSSAQTKKKKKGVSLMDSKQKDKSWSDKSDPMRPVSPPPPPPPFTTVKEPSGSPDNQDPSKPSGPDPVSPEASETYLADVPNSFSVTSGDSGILEEEGQPLSPGSMSYKTFLDSLPHQLIPGVKRGGKKGGKLTSVARSNFSVLGSLVSSTSTTSSSSSSASSTMGGGGGGVVERRASVRSSECAFRYKQIVVKKCYHFTQIWLNTQTPMKNALNPTVIQELISAMNSAKYDDSHLVLFSGFGPVFCSGTDLHYLVTGDRRLAARQMAERIRELTKTFISFPKPIIAAVSGAAVGLGVSLLLLCDVVYASDKASFHLPYSQLSQTPEGCSSFTLPHTLGFPSANELLFGGRKITAMEAYQLGLVSQVFWPTLMMQEVIPRAQHMAASSAKALEATKLLVRSHYRTKMEVTNETECNLLLERWLSIDCQHAIEAYIANEKNWAFLQ